MCYEGKKKPLTYFYHSKFIRLLYLFEYLLSLYFSGSRIYHFDILSSVFATSFAIISYMNYRLQCL